MKSKKPKKSRAEQRKSHLALQARRDALARMRNGEVVSIKLADGRIVKARALDSVEDPHSWLCLAIVNRRLVADWCSDKDGLKIGDRRLKRSDILGVVLYVDRQSPYVPGSRAPDYTRIELLARAAAVRDASEDDVEVWAETLANAVAGRSD